MRITRLQAQNIRSFQTLDLNLTSGINIFIGENGVGKTSILESIDVLSRGKSFRSSYLSHVVSLDSQSFAVSAHVNSTQLGMRYAKNKTELKVDGEKVKRWSELAYYLPVISIHPESYLLVTGAPSERRKFIAWGVFHVEPTFLKLWLEYTKALKQRNLCLKNKQIKQARYWHPVLISHGQAITDIFERYVQALYPHISDLLAAFVLPSNIIVEFVPGWDKSLAYEAALENELNTDYPPPYTRVGPHRADLRLLWKGDKFAYTSSRGQQKILALVLKLAQARLLFANKNEIQPIYLIDELPAELDEGRTSHALDLITNTSSQALITSVSLGTLEKYSFSDTKLFHVEPGKVSEMV